MRNKFQVHLFDAKNSQVRTMRRSADKGDISFLSNHFPRYQFRIEVINENRCIHHVTFESSIPALCRVGGFKNLVAPSVVYDKAEFSDAGVENTFEVVLAIAVRRERIRDKYISAHFIYRYGNTGGVGTAVGIGNSNAIGSGLHRTCNGIFAGGAI